MTEEQANEPIATGGELTCPNCKQAWMAPRKDHFKCPKCDHVVRLSDGSDTTPPGAA